MPTQSATNYKLRTKVINVPGYPNGFHAATAWNNQNKPLDVLPPAATYPTVLYWLKYDTTGNTLLEIGPYKTVTFSVDQTQVQLTAYWFNQVARPAISYNQPIPPQYKLATQVLYGSNPTFDVATAWNNQGHPLDQLPVPGTYQATLFWQKYNITGTTVVESGPLRQDTITVVNGPISLLNAGGFISWTDWTDDDGNSGTDYSSDIYDFVVPTAGQLSLRSSGPTNLTYWLYDPNGWDVSHGDGNDNFSVVLNVQAGAHRLLVYGNNSGGPYSVAATLTPAVPPPAITSPTLATATLGTPFSYTITTDTTANARYAGGLPLGLTCNSATGVISGTPTQISPAPFPVQLYATRDGLTGPTTTLSLTVTGATPTLTFAGQTFSTPTTITAALLQNNTTLAGANNLPAPTGNITYAITTGGSGNPLGQLLSWGTQVTVTASYPGDANYAPKTTTATFTVIPAANAATNISSTQFVANWAPVTGASGYLLDVATSSNFAAGSFVLQNQPVSGTANFVTGVSPGTTYYYRVRAVTSSGTTAYSSAVSVQTLSTYHAASLDTTKWLDLHTTTGTGLPDEIIGEDASRFAYAITEWYTENLWLTEQLEIWTSPINSYFLLWQDYYGIGADSTYPGTGLVWAPPDILLLQYDQVETWVHPEFHCNIERPDPSQQNYDYRIYQYGDPAAWVNILNLGHDLNAGWNSFPGIWLTAGDFKKEHFYLARFAKPIASTTLSIGSTTIGIGVSGGSAGPITIPNIGTVTITGNTTSVVLPDGTVISVDRSLGRVLKNGDPIDILNTSIGNISIKIDSTGGELSIPGGPTVHVNPNGSGSIVLPGGSGISVSSTGVLSVNLPSTVDPAIVKAVDVLGKILQANKGAKVSLIDVLGVLGVKGGTLPFPASGVIQDIFLGTGKSSGIFSVGVQIDDTHTFWFDVAIGLPPPQIAVDANRDGAITFDTTDATAADKPYRFWINDDDDEGYGPSFPWGDPDPEHYPPRRADSADQIINGARDCEDLTRIWISAAGLIDTVKDTSGDLYLGLKWKNTNGTHPGIRLFRSADTTGGLGYIKDATIGAQQGTGAPGSVATLRACLGDADAQTTSTPPIGYPWTSGITQVEPIVRDADFIFRKDALTDVFGNRTTGYLLFEGVQEGKGELMLVVVRKKSDGTWEKVSEGGSVWLQLDNIRRMYVRAHSEPLPENFPQPWQVTSPPPGPYDEDLAHEKALSIPDNRLWYGAGDSVESSTQFPFVPSPGEQNKCIIFVHGIDMSVPEMHGYAESCFKRLWWEGYRGRFISFRWETPLYADGVDSTSTIFDSGEYRSWKGGASLKKFADALRNPASPFYFSSNPTIGLFAHSLGNACAGEALRQGMQVNSYVALKAAVSLSCYYPVDTPAPPRQILVDADAAHPTPQYAGFYNGYHGYLSSIGGANKVNYYGAKDFWLETGHIYVGTVQAVSASWVTNEMQNKPCDPPDGFMGTNGLITYLWDVNQLKAYFRHDAFYRLVTDPHESMAFVSRPRTSALGATAAPSSFGNLDLDATNTYGFTEARFDHSGPFQRDIQLMYGDANGASWSEPLYVRLMRDLQVSP